VGALEVQHLVELAAAHPHLRWLVGGGKVVIQGQRVVVGTLSDHRVSVGQAGVLGNRRPRRLGGPLDKPRRFPVANPGGHDAGTHDLPEAQDVRGAQSGQVIGLSVLPCPWR